MNHGCTVHLKMNWLNLIKQIKHRAIDWQTNAMCVCLLTHQNCKKRFRNVLLSPTHELFFRHCRRVWFKWLRATSLQTFIDALGSGKQSGNPETVCVFRIHTAEWSASGFEGAIELVSQHETESQGFIPWPVCMARSRHCFWLCCDVVGASCEDGD